MSETESKVFDRSEYYFSPKMNSLIEVVKSFELTAVIRPFPQRDVSYSVITSPITNKTCIGWHLKFDGYDKQTAVQAAMSMNESLHNAELLEDFPSLKEENVQLENERQEEKKDERGRKPTRSRK